MDDIPKLVKTGSTQGRSYTFPPGLESANSGPHGFGYPFPSTHHMVFSYFPMFSHDFLMKTSIDIRLPMIFPGVSHLRMRLSRGLRPLHGGLRQALRCVLQCHYSVAQVMDDHRQNRKIKGISPTINDHYIPLYTITNDY